MQSVELYVNGESLDLSDKTVISLVLQAQDIGDISDKVGSYSRSFTVPATAKNRGILDNTFTYNTLTTFPYRRHYALLNVNGLQLAEGTVIVENNGIKEDEIRLTFYTGNSPFYQLITNIPLRSLPFFEAQHNRFASTIYQKRDCTGVYGYPAIAYTDNTTDISNVSNSVNMRVLMPCLKLSYVMDKIAERLGYTFTGDLFNDVIYDKIVFPVSTDKLLRDKYGKNRNEFKVGNYNIQPILQAGIPNNPIVPYKVQCATFSILAERYNEAIDIENPVRRPFITPPLHPINTWRNNLWIIDSGIYNCKIRFRWNNTSPQPVKVYPYFLDMVGITTELDPSGNGAVYVGDLTVSGFGLNDDNPIPVSAFGYETVITYTAFKGAHTNEPMLEVYSDQDWQITLVEFEQLMVEDLGTPDEKRVIDYDASPNSNNYYCEQLSGSPNYPFPSYSVFSPSICLPDITIGAFLKAITNMFGIIIFINEGEKKIDFFPIYKLRQNLPYALDWSAKLVNEINTVINTRPKKYAQNNYFKYTETDGVDDTFGMYTLPIDDNTLPQEYDLVKLPFGGSLNVNRFDITTPEELGYIERFVDTPNFKGGDYEGADNVQRVMILDEFRNADIISNPVNFINVHKGGTQTYTDNTGTWVVGYFYRTSNMPLSALQLSYRDYMYETYYSSLETVVDRYKDIQVFMKLDSVDIQTLNYKLPIYLRQYNAYYYIQRIADWVDGEKPVKVELLKLA